MIRRTYSGPQPALTGGTDRPQPACLGRPEPYDALHDLTAGPAFKAAVREARSMCESCPIAATCLTENRHEPWARAVLGKNIARPSQAQGDANRLKAEAAQKKWAARREARIIELRELIERGADLDEVLDMLGMTYPAFRKFCRRYAPDELAVLTGQTVAA